MLPWLQSCYDFASNFCPKATNIDVSSCMSYSLFIRMLVVRVDLEQTDNGKNKLSDWLVMYFTNDLKDRIRNLE